MLVGVVEAKKEGRSPRSTPGVFQGVPLDVLLKPINLACGAKNPLLQETALGCLHKIIAYGHLKDHKLLKEVRRRRRTDSKGSVCGGR